MTIIRAMGELRIDFADPNKAVKFLYFSIDNAKDLSNKIKSYITRNFQCTFSSRK